MSFVHGTFHGNIKGQRPGILMGNAGRNDEHFLFYVIYTIIMFMDRL